MARRDTLLPACANARQVGIGLLGRRRCKARRRGQRSLRLRWRYRSTRRLHCHPGTRANRIKQRSAVSLRIAKDRRLRLRATPHTAARSQIPLRHSRTAATGRIDHSARRRWRGAQRRHNGFCCCNNGFGLGFSLGFGCACTKQRRQRETRCALGGLRPNLCLCLWFCNWRRSHLGRRSRHHFGRGWLRRHSCRSARNGCFRRRRRGRGNLIRNNRKIAVDAACKRWFRVTNMVARARHTRDPVHQTTGAGTDINTTATVDILPPLVTKWRKFSWNTGVTPRHSRRGVKTGSQSNGRQDKSG